METKKVIKIGKNFKIGKAIITPELLSEIENLQDNENYMIVSQKDVIADIICLMLRENAGDPGKEEISLLTDLASIRLNMDSFSKPNMRNFPIAEEHCPG